MNVIMTNAFTELSAYEMMDVAGGKVDVNVNIDFDVNDFINNGLSNWWNFWEGVGGDIYDAFH